MKNLIVLIAIVSFAFTMPVDEEIIVKANMENGDLLVNVNNKEKVDLDLKITVYDANDKKVAKIKGHLGINTSDNFLLLGDKNDFKNYPLKVIVKGKGREKAMFITTIKTVTVDR